MSCDKFYKKHEQQSGVVGLMRQEKEFWEGMLLFQKEKDVTNFPKDKRCQTFQKESSQILYTAEKCNLSYITDVFFLFK